MRRFGLRDDQWERIKDLLPEREGSVGVTAADNRLFVEAAAPAAHRRQGRRSVQGPGARSDTAASRGKPGPDDRRPEPAAAGGGPAISASANCTSWHRWTAGHADACVASSGSSGRRGAIAIGNFVA